MGNFKGLDKYKIQSLRWWPSLSNSVLRCSSLAGTPVTSIQWGFSSKIHCRNTFSCNCNLLDFRSHLVAVPGLTCIGTECSPWKDCRYLWAGPELFIVKVPDCVFMEISNFLDNPTTASRIWSFHTKTTPKRLDELHPDFTCHAYVSVSRHYHHKSW